MDVWNFENSAIAYRYFFVDSCTRLQTLRIVPKCPGVSDDCIVAIGRGCPNLRNIKVVLNATAELASQTMPSSPSRLSGPNLPIWGAGIAAMLPQSAFWHSFLPAHG